MRATPFITPTITSAVNQFSRRLHALLTPLILVVAFLPQTLLGSEELPTNTPVDDAASTSDNARLPLKELQLFALIFDQIRSSYVEEVDDKTLLENPIIGLLGDLDPPSTFLTK